MSSHTRQNQLQAALAGSHARVPLRRHAAGLSIVPEQSATAGWQQSYRQARQKHIAVMTLCACLDQEASLEPCLSNVAARGCNAAAVAARLQSSHTAVIGGDIQDYNLTRLQACHTATVQPSSWLRPLPTLQCCSTCGPRSLQQRIQDTELDSSDITLGASCARCRSLSAAPPTCCPCRGTSAAASCLLLAPPCRPRPRAAASCCCRQRPRQAKCRPSRPFLLRPVGQVVATVSA